MRLKLVDRSIGDLSETGGVRTLNALRTQKMVFEPNDGKGYSLLLEGMMPYNCPEGSLSLEVLTNREELSFENIELVEG